jgi:hypothetical protein
MATSETTDSDRPSERASDSFADVPWGVAVFLLLAIGGLAWTICGHLTDGDYMGAVASGSGLLAVGHGIRTRGRGR